MRSPLRSDSHVHHVKLHVKEPGVPDSAAVFFVLPGWAESRLLWCSDGASLSVSGLQLSVMLAVSSSG